QDAINNNIELKTNTLNVFKASLSDILKEHFDNEIEPFLDDRGQINDKLDYFNPDLARRYIFPRVIELGWNPKLHGEFDQITQRGHPENDNLTIARKYQWIALYELIARISDNFKFRTDIFNSKYESPWQLD